MNEWPASRSANGKWRARYRDDAGKEHARHFGRKTDAQTWLDEQTAKLVSGMHVTPRTARTTVGEWCDTWLEGYKTRRSSTVRQAEAHLARIRGGLRPHAALGGAAVARPHVDLSARPPRGWPTSYVYALHARLAQLFSDAVHDGLVAKSPCSRRTSPGGGQAARLRRDD